ncbi:hypothetical protein CH267_19535 [Rhodococcus sp. 06-621-2]|nr:hypothetical protein CH267_19535 [Rhodococcus sp. 06-621-2]
MELDRLELVGRRSVWHRSSSRSDSGRSAGSTPADSGRSAGSTPAVSGRSAGSTPADLGRSAGGFDAQRTRIGVLGTVDAPVSSDGGR